MYLVEISGDSAGKRRLLYLLADDPPLRSHGGISELADYFPAFFLFCNYTGSLSVRPQNGPLDRHRSCQMVIVVSYLDSVED